MSSRVKIIIGAALAVVAGGALLWYWRSRPLVVLPPSGGEQNVAPAASAPRRLEALDTRVKTDQDFDGLSDEAEAKLGTSPTSADTDSDGLIDSVEVEMYGTDPLKSDTRGTGHSDSYGVRQKIIVPISTTTASTRASRGR